MLVCVHLNICHVIYLVLFTDMENINFPIYYDVPIAVQENGEREPPPYPYRPPPYPQRPPPYPGRSGTPPPYPGLYFSPKNQPYPRQPELIRSHVVQPMGINRLNMHRLHSTQPGNPETHPRRIYQVKSGRYTPYPGMCRPHLQQFLGGDASDAHYGPPSQVYNGEPGTHRRINPRQSKGFVGSLMSPDAPNGSCRFTRNNVDESTTSSNNVITEEEFSFWAVYMNNAEELTALQKICEENLSVENDNVITEEEFSFWAEKLMNNTEELAALRKICEENLSVEFEVNERQSPLHMLQEFVRKY